MRLATMKLAFCVVAVVAAVALPTSQAAMILGADIPLSDLLGSGTVVVGDKEFSNFGYSFTGDMPDATGVNVTPIKDDDGNFGIRFQGAFLDHPSSQGGSDALITYVVTALDPNMLIVDAHIAGNPDLLGIEGSISVTETFLPLGANDEFTMTIFDDSSQPTPKLVDWTDFDQPYRSLNVQKDILAFAVNNGSTGGGGSTVTLSFVDQTFSQVPEPTALVLLGGMLGTMAVVRYRLG